MPTRLRPHPAHLSHRPPSAILVIRHGQGPRRTRQAGRARSAEAVCVRHAGDDQTSTREMYVRLFICFILFFDCYEGLKRSRRLAQGVHAADMSPPTPNPTSLCPGWRITPLGRLVRPIRIRPNRPLPMPVQRKKRDHA